jgi:uncharacterized protein YndB with AHSA1/START domain
VDGDRFIGGLDINTYTDAPLRLAVAAFLDAPPREVFAVVGDHAALEYWFPMIEKVNLNRGHAAARDGVGTIRYLHYPFWTMREYVIAVDPPHLMAYSIEQNALIINHVAVMYLEAERYGGTNLSWRHYFRTSTLPFISTPLLTLAGFGLYRAALTRLIRLFDGKLLN